MEMLWDCYGLSMDFYGTLWNSMKILWNANGNFHGIPLTSMEIQWNFIETSMGVQTLVANTNSKTNAKTNSKTNSRPSKN